MTKAYSVLAALLIVSGTASPGSAQQSPEVSLALSQYENVNGVRVLVFAGAISSGAAGEVVQVLARDCGVRGYRLVGETRTAAGGRWRIENPSSDGRSFGWGSGTSFRARWADRLSDAITLRLPAQVWVKRVQGQRAWKVHVFTGRPGVTSLAGKAIMLQRARGSRWVTIQRARLVHRPSFELGPNNFEAVFGMRARGVRLRAFVPTASAAPCYLAAASVPWRT